MQYCNDCFAKMADKAKRCPNCQSRDLHTFTLDVSAETTSGIQNPATLRQKQVSKAVEDETAPPEPKKFKVDSMYLVEPKPKAADLRSEGLLYFPSDPKKAKKNASKSAKAQRRSRTAARGKPTRTGRRSFGAGFALFGPMALVLLFLGTIFFNYIPEEVKKGQIAWTEAYKVPERLYPKVDVDSDGEFKWLDGGKNSQALWDPCRPILWVVNPTNEPKIARQMLADAFSIVGASTGLKFEFSGETDEMFQAKRIPVNSKYSNLDSQWNPVLVTFLKGQDFEDATFASGNGKSNNIAAFAGPDSAFDGNNKLVYVSGKVTISADWFQRSMRDWGGIATKSTFLHELGHLVGLDHVSDPSELMHASSMESNVFGPGDRKGLALAGQAKCLSAADYPDPSGTDWSNYK